MTIVSHSIRMIYFFGPDGTGKTTHANLIANYLKRRGLRVLRASVKYHHTISYIILKTILCNRYGDRRLVLLNYYGFDKNLKARIKTPWKILELISLFPVIFYRVLLPMTLGYIIVCDRYILDTLVTLSYFLDDKDLLSGLLTKILVIFIPRNSLLFYMNADVNEILRRKKDEPLTANLIKNYKTLYDYLIQHLNLNVTIIDTSKRSIKDVYRMLIQLF